tara:strand:- start:423 stop:950 length:528 start_codon:yes stop_codon:yes gene_type:complete
MEDSLTLNTNSSNNCTICFLEISEEDKVILNCNHFFCNSCIQDWLNKDKNSCPLCRQEIKEYNHNDKNYRLIIKENNQRDLNDIDRQLVRINGRIKIYLCLSVACSTYFASMYFSILNNYNHLYNEYQQCDTNLTNILHNYNHNILHNVGIYSLDNHFFKSCSIPQYFYDKCFMN